MAVATGALIGSLAASVGGSVIGKLASSGDRAAAEKAMQAAADQIMSIGAPPDLAQEIIREQLKSVGIYNPQLEEAIQQDSTQFSKIQEDPQLRDAGMKALQALQQRGSQGLTAVERGAFNETRRQAAKEAEAKREQIIQNLAQRGLAGGGAEIAAQLSASQAGDERLSAEGDRLAALAAQNALQATTQAGSLGGQIRGQDFDVASTKARAEDELNRFNVGNQIARQQRNISEQNRAQMANLAEQQRIADYNTQQANAERLRQNEARRQNWADKLTQAQGKAATLAGQAQNFQQQAQNTAGTWQGIGQGVGGAINAYAANSLAQQKQPENTGYNPESEDYYNKLIKLPS